MPVQAMGARMVPFFFKIQLFKSKYLNRLTRLGAERLPAVGVLVPSHHIQPQRFVPESCPRLAAFSHTGSKCPKALSNWETRTV
jgi:hypothetical protein